MTELDGASNVERPDSDDLESWTHPLNLCANVESRALPIHVGVFIIADKYGINGLGDLACYYYTNIFKKEAAAHVLTGYFRLATRLIYSVPEEAGGVMRHAVARLLAAAPINFEQDVLINTLSQCDGLAVDVLLNNQYTKVSKINLPGAEEPSKLKAKQGLYQETLDTFKQ